MLPHAHPVPPPTILAHEFVELSRWGQPRDYTGLLMHVCGEGVLLYLHGHAMQEEGLWHHLDPPVRGDVIPVLGDLVPRQKRHVARPAVCAPHGRPLKGLPCTVRDLITRHAEHGRRGAEPVAGPFLLARMDVNGNTVNASGKTTRGQLLSAAGPVHGPHALSA